MATRIQHIVVDDVDGTDQKVGTYRFAFDGVEYEIDLADHNFDRFAAALRPFLAAARRLPKSRAGSTSRTAAGSTRESRAGAIRAWWAANQQLDLPAFKERGSIPHQVKAAFRAAQLS
ncbi:Lsr2 family protein [Actinoplanes sp. NPDC049668]|uniref:histone-like nucleoid-structuring protein Lsr2 n=1 Tax=unclassified Actinoplanes TaxID=2626549 RepID=UPI0033A7B124